MKSKKFEIIDFETKFGLKPLTKEQKKLLKVAVSKINEGFAAMIESGLPPSIAIDEVSFQCFELATRDPAYVKAYMKKFIEYIWS